MEFNEKLQNLRRERGLTQEELANALFVSRTAISKWESARGYPNIDSLRQIAKFFGVSLDTLLSPDEALSIAAAVGKENESRFRDLVFGLIDLSLSLLLFLPFFAQRGGVAISSISLIALTGISVYLKISFISVIALSVICGVSTLALTELNLPFWNKHKNALSLMLNALSTILFTLSLHPYAAAFSFVLLAITTFQGVVSPFCLFSLPFSRFYAG